MRRSISPVTMEITPLSVTEEFERLLTEATKRSENHQQEVLQLCLEHGIH
jgi:hypothetical protein